MRLFLAIPLPAPHRSALQQVTHRLAATRADVKWVPVANLHITLRFLGEVDDGRLTELEDLLRPLPAAVCAPRLRLQGLGCFPGRGAPRVVWCGLREGGEALRELVSQINDQLTTIGFPDEKRPYSPHVTLGRVRSRQGSRDLLQCIENTAVDDLAAFVPAAVQLVQSHLGSTGARYEVRGTLPFAER